MKKSLYLILIMSMFIAWSSEVNASSGALRKNSIKMCNGLIYGQHSSDNHWHVAEESDGRYYATGNPIYSDPCGSSNNSSYSNSSSSNNTESSSSANYNSNSESNSNSNISVTKNDYNSTANVNSSSEIEEIKSNDNTLKRVIIDGKDMNVNDNIDYSTKKEKIIIKATTNNEKAKYEIKNNSTLKIGENKILIEVTAEDGTTKIYNINVKREKVLSSDNGIKVNINGEDIKFRKNKAIIYVGSTEKKLKIDYTLNDKNAKVEMNTIEELKTGDNELKIKVFAEDGTEGKYEITIHKNTKLEEIISTIFAFIIIGGMGYGIYYVIKKVKNKISDIKN